MLRKTMGAVAISAALFAPVMSTTVFAATAASEQQATANLVKQLSGVKSFTANFEQTTKATQTGKVAQKKGFNRSTYESNF